MRAPFNVKISTRAGQTLTEKEAHSDIDPFAAANLQAH